MKEAPSPVGVELLAVKKMLMGTAVLLALVVTIVAQDAASPSVPRERPHASPERFVSPDKKLLALVVPGDKAEGHAEDAESRVEIRSRGGALLSMDDFSSDDGDHGYAVAGAQWTPNSQFFVFRLRSSGGHQPMNAPVVFWNRKTNRFCELTDYTGDMTFSVTAPDSVSVDTWPDLQPAILSLHSLQGHQVTCEASPEAIYVTVAVDANSPAFKMAQQKLMPFSLDKEPPTPIIVAYVSMSRERFRDYLVNRIGISGPAPDIVILSSPEQAYLSPIARRESANARDACGGPNPCPAFIPSWVTRERLDAVQQVFRVLTAQ